MALIAHNLCEAVKQQTDDKVLIAEMKKSMSEWSTVAIDFLNECYQTSEEGTLDYLTMIMPFWNNTSCLDLAVESRNMEFLAQQASRNLFGKVWNGTHEKTNFEMVGFGPLAERIVLWIFWWMFARWYFAAPKTKFACNLISFLVFLSLFAYVLLFGLTNTVSTSEFLLLTWVLAILVEEIRQMHQIYKRPGHDKAFIRVQRIRKLKNYFSEGWNCIDMITIVMFLLGFGLRFKQFRDTFDWPRVVLAVDFVVFFFRLVHIFSIQKILGPKLIIILRMVHDLLYFLVIMAVFLLAYAIASYSILYPDAPVTWETARQIITKPYWHLYGELFLDETEDVTGCTNDASIWTNGTSPRCPSATGKIVVPIMMGVYLMFSNILLLNLLIAMFSFTFNEIHKQSDTIWCFQRYFMIKEYAMKPVLCPPLNVFWHIYKLFQCCLKKCTIPQVSDDPFHISYDDTETYSVYLINGHSFTLSEFMQEATGRYAQTRKLNETENNASRIKAAHENAMKKRRFEYDSKQDEEFQFTMLNKTKQAAEREDEFRRLVLAQLNKMQESIDVLHRKKADSEHKAD